MIRGSVLGIVFAVAVLLPAGGVWGQTLYVDVRPSGHDDIVFEGETGGVFEIFLENNAVALTGGVNVDIRLSGRGGLVPNEDVERATGDGFDSHSGFLDGSATIPEGQNSVRVASLITDNIAEFGEILQIVISNATGASAQIRRVSQSGRNIKVTFVHVRDTHTIAFTSPTTTTIERSEGGTAELQALIRGGLTTEVMAALSISGVTGGDYEVITSGTSVLAGNPPSVVFSQGGVNAVIRIQITDDDVPEGNEEMLVTFGAISGHIPYNGRLVVDPVTANGQRRIRIPRNDGSLTASLGPASPTSAREGQQVRIPVNFNSSSGGLLAGLTTYVHFEIAPIRLLNPIGSAITIPIPIAGLDYRIAGNGITFSNSSLRGRLRVNHDSSASLYIPIDILTDALSEPSEMFNIRIFRHNYNANVNDVTVPFNAPDVDYDGTNRTVTVLENAPIYVAVDTDAGGFRGFLEGTDAVFQFTLIGPARGTRDRDVIVEYQFAGTASAADYTDSNSGRITIPSTTAATGADPFLLTIPLSDNEDEGDTTASKLELDEPLTLSIQNVSGGGDGGALISSTAGSATATIDASTSIVHFGDVSDACIVQSATNADCPALAPDIIEGDTWRVPVTVSGHTDWDSTIIVFYRISGGTATVGDYSITRTATHEPGQLFGARLPRDTIDIDITADDIPEEAETLTLEITSARYGLGTLGARQPEPEVFLHPAYKTITATIADADFTASVSADKTTAAEGEEVFFAFSFVDNFGRTNTPQEDVTINYEIGGSTGVSRITPEDYTDPSGGSITIATADLSSGGVRITIVDDILAEGDETLTFTITSASGGAQNVSATAGSASVSIPVNDGVLVYPRFVGVTEVDETARTVNYQICTLGLDWTSTRPGDRDLFLVSWAFSGSAVGDTVSSPVTNADYRRVAVASTTIYGEGAHTCHDKDLSDDGFFRFTINNDNRNEGAETVVITITGAGFFVDRGDDNPVQRSTEPATLTINASDPLSVTVTESNAATVAEGGSLNYVVGYGTTNVPSAALTVNYTVSGVTVDDITATSLDGSITIPAGGANEAGRTVTITIADDDDTENAEDITVTFTGYSGGDGSGVINFTAADFTHTIPANDGILARVTAGDDVDEGAQAVFEFTVIGEVGTSMYTVTYATGGTFEGAAADDPSLTTVLNCANDIVDGVCTVDVSIDIPDDDIVEGDETLTVTLSSVTGTAASVDSSVASLTVGDSTELSLSIAAPAESVSRGDSANFALNFNLAPGVTLAAAVVVEYSFVGDAVTDGSGMVTVAAGETAGVIAVAIPDDGSNSNLPASTLTVTVDSVTAGVAIAESNAIANIAASNPITVTATGGGTVNEGGNATVNIALGGGVLTEDLVLEYSVSGDGAPDTDGGGTYTIATTDSAPYSFDIAITDDDDNEADEEFTVTIDTATTAGNVSVNSDGLLAFTIAANDAVTVTASGGGTVAEGNAVTFTVTVGGGVRSTELTVPWTIGTDSDAATDDATAATDYTVTGTSPLSIAVGETTATVTVTAIEDGVMESAEVFLFTVGSVTGGGPGERMVSGSPQTVTIDASTNKDRVVRLSGPATVAEGATTTNYSVVISGDAPTADVTVTWSITGVTAAAADFMGGALPSGGDLTFTASNYTTAQTFTVITAQDALHEADETFTVGISVATTSTGDTATDGDDLVTAITDNDAVTVTVSGGGAVDEGDSHTFTITLGGGTRSAAVTVPWSISGTAAAGDYTTTAMTPLSIAAADASGTVVLNIVDDGVMESAETLIFTVDTPSGGGGGAFTVSGSPQTATIAASEDTMRSVAITGPATVTEGDTTTVYSVAVTGDRPSTDISVTWSVTADTAAAADFSGGTLPAGATLTFTPANYATAQTFTIATAEDTLLEASEMFSVNIAIAYSGTGDIAGDGAAAVTAITDDDTASVTVARTDTDAFAEGGSGTAATAVFTVTVADATLTADAVVTFTVGGGTVTDDYTFAPADGMLTISGTTGTVTVTAVDDSLNESNEVITVTVTDATSVGNITVGSTAAATAAITDNDPLSVTIRAGQSSVLEGGMAVFTVAVAGTSTAAVVVPYTIGGDVVAADYTDVGGGELTIAAGQSEGSFSIQTVDDEMMEVAEDLTVTLGTSPSSAGTVNVGAENSATLSIAANASTVRDFSISVDDETVSEGDTVTFTVSLAGRTVAAGTPATVMVMVDANDDAEVTDYTPTTISRALSLGSLGSSEFTVTIVDDDINEGAEELTVMLTNPAGGGVGGTGLDVASVTVTIAASDPITYAIGDDAAVNEDTTQTHSFDVTLSGAARSEAGAVTVPFTVGGSATVGDDYTVNTMELLFATGVGTMDIELTVQSDGVFESREDVVIHLNTPTAGPAAGDFTPGDVDARLTILNDDALRVSIARTDSDGFTEGVTGVGGNAVFTVTVANGTSTAPVMVTFAIGGVGITAGDYTVTPASPLTIAAGVATGTVTVTATDDSLGEAAEVLTVTVTDVTGGGGMDPPTVTTAMASATIEANAGTATVARVGTGAVDEGDEVQFQITLSEPNAAAVMVAWSAAMETQTNTDAAGLRRRNNAQAPEFVNGDANGLSVSGTVNIPPMTASAMFSLTPNQDASEEDAEEVMVRLGAVTVGTGGGAVTASATPATVTVRANEAVIRDEALLAEQMKSVSALLGRAAAVLTATVVRERLLRRPTSRTLNVAGRPVAVANEQLLASATGPWAADPFLRASVAAADATGAAVTASDLVHGTAFALPLFGREWATGDASLWGAGGGISGSGTMGQLSYDEDATAFHIGADREWGDGFVAGLSIARTVGEVDAKQTVSNIEIKNRTESQMVSVHPYVLRRLGDHSHGWLVLGIGKSSVDVQETQFNVVRRASSDLTMTMAAFGAAWRRPGDDICVFDLTVHADGVLTRNQLQSATFDDGSLLPKVTSDTMQVNLATEAGRTWECARGIMRTYATAALRDEFGDAKPDGGTAADVGGRLEWDGANGILLRLRAAKQLVGDGDSTRWSAEVDWNRAHRGFALAPYAQLTTNTWRTGLRMSGGRVTVRFGIDLDEDGVDYRHLLRGDVSF